MVLYGAIEICSWDTSRMLMDVPSGNGEVEMTWMSPFIMVNVSICDSLSEGDAFQQHIFWNMVIVKYSH